MIIWTVSALQITMRDLGSSEESGKDWDELEEEARRGQFTIIFCV